ncbi:MAG TPA: sulfatase [Membranihabitans sp.]|nr:sulfatase [Membranihabitans sp.]
MKSYIVLKYLFCGFILCAGSWSCQENAEEPRPNILLIVSEDNSQDLGCYGNSIVHTPNLDSLAQNGIRFLNAYTTYSVCSPSRSSIFTGLYPHQNGQIGWATHHYSMYEGIKVLPQYLENSGYKTGVIGKIHVNPENLFNFDLQAIPGSNFQKKDLPLYGQTAKDFIDQSKSEGNPYFLMVNFPDAHLPFQNEVEGLPTTKVNASQIDSSLPFVGAYGPGLKTATEAYYNCMNRLDESIGMLLDSIGDLSNTCIIYLSDHGAQFSRGKMTNYEGGIKIPFIIHWPGRINKPQIKEELISVIDLLPTIIEITETPVPEHLPGKSLISLFNQDQNPQDWREYLFAEGEGSSPVQYFPMRSVRNKNFKLILNIDVGRKISPAYQYYIEPEQIHGTNEEDLKASTPMVQNAYNVWKSPPQWELYNLQEDAWEFENLADDPSYDDILKELQNAMQKWREQTNDPFLDPIKLNQFTAEMDSINQLYPDYTYRTIENFKWKYHDYLNQ